MTEQDNIAGTLKQQEVLGKLMSLSVPTELPKDFMDLHNRVWGAFNLGREYEKEVEGNG